MDSRIAQRRAAVRAERTAHRRRWTLAAGALVAVAALLVAVERSPLLALRAVEVVGTERSDPTAVREAAALPTGTSTVRLRLGPAAERVEALPEVRRATLRRTDALTVRITVEERRPVLAVDAGGDERLALVDRDGIVVAHREAGRLAVVAADDVARPEPGASILDDPALRSAFAVYRALPGPLRADVSAYEVGGPDEVELVLDGQVRVRLGRAERIPEKARALGALLDDLPAGESWVIDVRAPSHPVVVAPGEAADGDARRVAGAPV